MARFSKFTDPKTRQLGGPGSAPTDVSEVAQKSSDMALANKVDPQRKLYMDMYNNMVLGDRQIDGMDVVNADRGDQERFVNYMLARRSAAEANKIRMGEAEKAVRMLPVTKALNDSLIMKPDEAKELRKMVKTGTTTPEKEAAVKDFKNNLLAGRVDASGNPVLELTPDDIVKIGEFRKSIGAGGMSEAQRKEAVKLLKGNTIGRSVVKALVAVKAAEKHPLGTPTPVQAVEKYMGPITNMAELKEAIATNPDVKRMLEIEIQDMKRYREDKTREARAKGVEPPRFDTPVGMKAMRNLLWKMTRVKEYKDPVKEELGAVSAANMDPKEFEEMWPKLTREARRELVRQVSGADIIMEKHSPAAGTVERAMDEGLELDNSLGQAANDKTLKALFKKWKGWKLSTEEKVLTDAIKGKVGGKTGPISDARTAAQKKALETRTKNAAEKRALREEARDAYQQAEILERGQLPGERLDIKVVKSIPSATQIDVDETIDEDDIDTEANPILNAVEKSADLAQKRNFGAGHLRAKGKRIDEQLTGASSDYKGNDPEKLAAKRGEAPSDIKVPAWLKTDAPLIKKGRDPEAAIERYMNEKKKTEEMFPNHFDINHNILVDRYRTH
ncbi:MAG: hypothetical protein Pg6A_19890 [Termitinemataceae bacterium]|nr:MAG: hypothetical protein Pg6A_19890 [Termitinemataceae bacterium]